MDYQNRQYKWTFNWCWYWIIWQSLNANSFYHKLCDLHWIHAFSISVFVEKYIVQPFVSYKLILKNNHFRFILFCSFLQALKFPLFKYLTIIKIFLDVKFENLNANWNDIQIGILTIILLLHWWTNYYLAYFLVSCYIKLQNTMPHIPIKILVNNK